MSFVDATPVVLGTRAPTGRYIDFEPRTNLLNDVGGAIVRGELRLDRQTRRPSKERLLVRDGQRRHRPEVIGFLHLHPVRGEVLLQRLEHLLGDSVRMQHLAVWRLERSDRHIERLVVVGPSQRLFAERVEHRVERHLEIRRQMRPQDMLARRAQIVGEARRNPVRLAQRRGRVGARHRG